MPLDGSGPFENIGFEWLLLASGDASPQTPLHRAYLVAPLSLAYIELQNSDHMNHDSHLLSEIW